MKVVNVMDVPYMMPLGLFGDKVITIPNDHKVYTVPDYDHINNKIKGIVVVEGPRPVIDIKSFLKPKEIKVDEVEKSTTASTQSATVTTTPIITTASIESTSDIKVESIDTTLIVEEVTEVVKKPKTKKKPLSGKKITKSKREKLVKKEDIKTADISEVCNNEEIIE